jgi:hypothetical protein
MMRKLFTILIAVLSIQFSFNLSAECIEGNCVNGRGTFNYDNGDQYSGENKDNKKHGKGIFTFGPKSEWAGDQYIGEHEDNKRHGQGTYNFANGDQYIGEFKDDMMHGQGTYTYANGTSDTGIWRNGELISDVCKGMGLSPNTEAYGKCILKMMD